MSRQIVLIHGYSASGLDFTEFCNQLRKRHIEPVDINIANYVSLNNEITIKDIAEGFDRALRNNPRLNAEQEFDAIVHSTGMLVLRSWLTNYGEGVKNNERVARLKHLVGLAPATWGSPQAHKGRTWIGELVKGNKEPGPDFLNAGNQVLCGLELGSRFTWDLAHLDLLGERPFYDKGPDTPYVSVFIGNSPYTGISSVANDPGTDGTVRWSGCALNTRKITIDLTRIPAGMVGTGASRVSITPWADHVDIPMIPVEGRNHATLVSNPDGTMVDLICEFLNIADEIAYGDWLTRAEASGAEAKKKMLVNPGRDAAGIGGDIKQFLGHLFHEAEQPMEGWQQFVVHARDERGDPVRDYLVDVLRKDDHGNWVRFDEMYTDVHPYGADPSYRCFHVRLPKGICEQNVPLQIRFSASTGTALMAYQGYSSDDAGKPMAATTGPVTIDINGLEDASFFYPFTTTLVEIVINREPYPLEKVSEILKFLMPSFQEGSGWQGLPLEAPPSECGWPDEAMPAAAVPPDSGGEEAREFGLPSVAPRALAPAPAPAPAEPEAPEPKVEGSWELKLERPLTVRPPLDVRKHKLSRIQPPCTDITCEGATGDAMKADLVDLADGGVTADSGPAEYVNFEVFDVTDSAVRKLEVHEGLYRGLDYRLVVGMGMMQDRRFGAGKQEKIERPKGTKAVLDVVLILEENLEFPAGSWAMLEWPEKGPSVKNAEFLFRPIASGRANVKVLMYHQHDLIFYGHLDFEVQPEGEDFPEEGRPIRWKTMDSNRTSSLTPFRRFHDLDQEGKRGVNISVHRRSEDIFDLVFFLRGSGPVPPMYPLRVTISMREVAGYLARTRSALRLLTDTYQHQETDTYSAETFLDDMSLIGNEIWRRLFGSEAGQRMAEILKRELTREGTIVQVWTEVAARDFMLPWAWIYPQRVIPGRRQQTDARQFWGYQFVVEQLRQQLLNEKRPASVMKGEPLRLTGALHGFPAAPSEREFFEQCSEKYAARLAWKELKPAEWRDFLPKCNAHLVYLYCHGHTQQVLSPEEARTYRGLLREMLNLTTEESARMESMTDGMRKLIRGQTAIMIGNETLNLQDINTFNVDDPTLAPVIFLNMCESAEFYPGATDNLIDSLLTRGALGVIGTEVPVLAAFGDAFARGFFEAFFAAGKSGEGREIGAVIWQLRRIFLDQGNPLGFVYTYFGDVTTRLKPAIIELEEPIIVPD